MSKVEIIMSCEHGGNDVPKQYLHLFQGAEQTLEGDEGYDIGALTVAKKLAKNCECPLVSNTISKLLIDVNRSIKSRTLFSEYTWCLLPEEKDAIIRSYYIPYKEKLTKAIQTKIAQDKKVVHLSVHSFAPVVDGMQRNAEFGLLYDPLRAEERAFCNDLKTNLVASSPYVTRLNYPHLGTADSLTVEFRRMFSEANYVGIEMWINQKLLTDKAIKPKEVFEPLLESIVATVTTM